SAGCSAKQGAGADAGGGQTTAAGAAESAAPAVTGAGADAGAGEALPSGSITWLTNSAYGDVPQRLADAYMKHNPNATITLESYTRTQMMEVIEVKMGAGDNSYDVFFVDQPLIASYYWKDYLLPLNEYVSDADMEVFTDADKASSYVEGTLEALPLTSSSQVLMVNMDLMKEAGINFDEKYLNLEDRLTWEKLVEVAGQFQQKMDPDHTKGYWGFALGQQNNPYQILALGNSLGEKAIADDGVTVEGVFNTDGWVKALQFYQDLYTKYGVSQVGTTDDEVKALFYSGKCLFYLANTIRATEADFEIAGIYHPYFEGGEIAVPTGSWYQGINKATDNLELSLDFLKWCTIGEGGEIWMLNNNQVPARKDLLQNVIDDKYTEFSAWPGTATKLAAMENLAGHGYMRPTSYGWKSFDSITANMFADIRSGADVKETLEATTAQLQQDFNQYK
ncbi:MAG: extracellular solute-binding protein, partial [Clostridium sp.]|nr:extracellular solute-binding protein [Clostridium sp.]